MIVLLATLTSAQELAPALDQLATGGGDQVSTAVRLLMILTALSVLPGFLLLMTPFTRFVIVLGMLRQALGLQQSPPNQVLVGLSLLLSLVVMRPVLEEVGTNAVEPYMAGEIDHRQAWDAAMGPMRGFMFQHIRREDLATAIRIAHIEQPETLAELPTTVVVSAYVLSELTSAFVSAVKIAVPFVAIDLVVASVLLGMGMMMVPPANLALPIKLLVFVLMNGWSLLVLGLTGTT
jgi:flagellar biosynthesis protein FliP